MDASIFLAALAVVLLAVGLLLLWREGGAPEAAPAPGSARNPYHAVAISSPAGACEHALSLRGRRFLAAEAPLLPLPGCSAAVCSCIYQHFEDRRQQRRRDLYPDKVYMTEAEQIERRRSNGRRSADALLHPTV